MAKEKKGKNKLEDLGFGTRIVSKKRFINKDGSLNVVRTGYSNWTLYHHLTNVNWFGFFLHVVLYYVLVNSIFAIIYMMIGVETLSGVEKSSLWEDFSRAFFFSVQTFTTVGYGAISPIGLGANWVASFEALVGLLSAAIATGLMLSRFTRPKAQLIYSKHAVIAPFQNGSGLMFRIANTKDNKIMNLETKVSATWFKKVKGQEVRQYELLNLERDKIFLFPLSWTIVHPLDEKSPFFGKSREDFKKMNVEFLVMLEGYDESYNQEIYSNTSYTCDEVVWDAKFSMMFYSDKENGTVLELDKIDDIEYLKAKD